MRNLCDEIWMIERMLWYASDMKTERQVPSASGRCESKKVYRITLHSFTRTLSFHSVLYRTESLISKHVHSTCAHIYVHLKLQNLKLARSFVQPLSTKAQIYEYLKLLKVNFEAIVIVYPPSLKLLLRIWCSRSKVLLLLIARICNHISLL